MAQMTASARSNNDMTTDDEYFDFLSNEWQQRQLDEGFSADGEHPDWYKGAEDAYRDWKLLGTF
jgi:hypothetical protein|tara:strand:+ start:598 stop:789 length:192 start_codon:yes stop_codon:yes gene_type:complete